MTRNSEAPWCADRFAVSEGHVWAPLHSMLVYAREYVGCVDHLAIASVLSFAQLTIYSPVRRMQSTGAALAWQVSRSIRKPRKPQEVRQKLRSTASHMIPMHLPRAWCGRMAPSLSLLAYMDDHLCGNFSSLKAQSLDHVIFVPR